MHVVVKDKTAELKTEATVQLDTLASRCKKENGKLEIWVRICVWSSLQNQIKSKQSGNKCITSADIQSIQWLSYNLRYCCYLVGKKNQLWLDYNTKLLKNNNNKLINKTEQMDVL